METPEGRCNEVPLDEVLSILAQSTRVENRLRTKFGLKESELALEMLRQARLAGDLGGHCAETKFREVTVGMPGVRVTRRYSGSLFRKTNKNSGVASLVGLLPSDQWR